LVEPGADQHFDGQAGSRHTGVNTAVYHLPSPAQAITLQEEPALHGAVQTMPGVQGAAAFFLAACDGIDVSATAAMVTAPTSRTFAMDFI
jgi:hypothetical protein